MLGSDMFLVGLPRAMKTLIHIHGKLGVELRSADGKHIGITAGSTTGRHNIHVLASNVITLSSDLLIK